MRWRCRCWWWGGTDDPVTNPEMARRLHAQAASDDKALVLVEGGAHNGLHGEPKVQAAYEALIETVQGPAPQASRD